MSSVSAPDTAPHWVRRALRARLGREIVLVLLVKLMLLAGLWLAFVKPNRVEPVPAEVAEALFGRAPIPDAPAQGPPHG